MRLQKTELQQIADEYEKVIQKEQQQAAEQAEKPSENKQETNK